ncbi:MAG: HAMP domain-containing histidine kinase [Acidobacteria bacterium]|nr:HAMP domain-containing histidine kinase [Acidobacteriota bacterium]
MLTLELAVVLPAAALIVVSVLHLKSIQRDRNVEAAIQRDFYQVLYISEKHLNKQLYEMADDMREDFPAAEQPCSVSSAVLDKALAAHPYIAHAFLYTPKNGLVTRSQPRRLQEEGFRIEADDFAKMLNGWIGMEFDSDKQKMEAMARKGMNYMSFVNWAPRGDKKLLYEPVAMFLTKDENGKTNGIGGVAFEAEYIRDRFLPEILENVMVRNLSESHNEKNPAVLMVRLRGEGSMLAASPGWDGGTPEVERNMDGALPGLTLAIKLRGTTLEAIGQRFVRISFLVLGGLSLLLAGGIFLTYRAITKELAVARLKSDFVSNVSHELRTPLSLIRLYAETLEMGRITSSGKAQEYYSIIRKESERLTGLINNILDFSRIEAGRKEYDFRETDLQELVRNTLESYRYQIEQHGFTFEEKIDTVPSLRVDREAIARSLLNLVNNALKYSQDRKYIGVNLYPSNGAVKLEVIDHGIGIPDSEQPKIFEKFYRVGDPLVHNTKGSGLGLSLVKHITQAHGGQVSVDSIPGQGSKFTITLPVNQPAQA